MTATAPSPLASRTFRALWIATIVSNIGTWMHDVGAAWLMTSLSPSPLMVALVQSATTLPMFLLALPAGALADIIDRRALLIAAQIWMFVATALLAATSFVGLTGPGLLLTLTFAIACGGAMSAPAFQATVPELVARSALPQAVTLNSLGVNIARAVGPALGGVIIAVTGPWAVFALNAVSVSGILIVLWRWQRPPRTSHLPPEQFLGAMRAGLRYAARAPALQTVLARSIGFFLFASALWALLPIIARQSLELSAAGYGALLTALGLGAVSGALLLPRLRGLVVPNRLTLAASLLFAGATAALSIVTTFPAAAAVAYIAGLAWIVMVAVLNGAAQLSVPEWVKARALAIFLLVFQGSMTAGAIFWGWLASGWGVPAALTIAAVAMVAALAIALRFPLGDAGALDLTPSLHWPSPLVVGELEQDRGPVMVMITYLVEPAEVEAFVCAMAPMRRIRRRDGGIAWTLYEDAAQPGTMVETFVTESWLEHLRQHDRVTGSDRVAQDAAGRFHRGLEPPIIRHLLTPR
jgi:MFS family permease